MESSKAAVLNMFLVFDFLSVSKLVVSLLYLYFHIGKQVNKECKHF